MRRGIMGSMGGIAAVAMIGAVSLPMPALRPDPVRIQAPIARFALSRRQRKRAAEKAERRKGHEANRKTRLRVWRERMNGLDAEERERIALIARMTNWRRSQWARAGYPQDIEDVREFVTLPYHGLTRRLNAVSLAMMLM